jgi:hypothetical protein
LITAAFATKKTGCQVVEGLYRKAHFPPVHARTIDAGEVATMPNSYTTTRWQAGLESRYDHALPAS